MSALMLIFLLCIAIVSMALGVVVLSPRERRPINIWLALIAISAGLWTFTTLFFAGQSNSDVSAAVVRLHYIVVLFIPISLYFFSLYYPYPRKFSAVRIVAVSVLGVGACAALLLPGSVKETMAGMATVQAVEALPYAVYLSLTSIIMSLALGSFLQNYRQSHVMSEFRTAQRVRDLMLSATIALVAVGVFNLLFPLLGEYSFVWIGPAFATILSGYIFYLIVHQGMFDVRAALARSVAYAVAVAVMVLLYAAVLFSSGDLLFPYSPPDTVQLIFYITVALILVVTVRPLQALIDRLTHNFFYQNDYEVETALQELSTVTSNEVELRRIVDGSLTVLCEAINPDYASLYILSAEGQTYHFGKSEPKKKRYRQQRSQLRVIGQVLDELPHVLRRSEAVTLEARKVMDKTEAAVIMQLVVQGEHLGVLFLGERRNGAPYSDKDMQLLRTASSELALAIQNGLRFEEIQQFNKRLRAEVTSATRQLRRSNRQLQQIDTVKDEFLSIASHQLRTPLTSIKGYLSMVLDGDAGSLTPKQQSLLEEAFAGSQRMVGLIEDFLNLSRLQTGRFAIEKQPVDLIHLVESEVAVLKNAAKTRSLKLQFSYKGDIPPILLLDGSKLRQVVMNFIDNAIYYSKPKTTIYVQVSREGANIRVTIRDTGMGVPAKEQARLFTKFYRASNARQRRPDGTGVGLYLAKKVVTEHGGEMIFRSTEGEGSTFGFTLPVADLLPSEDETK